MEELVLHSTHVSRWGLTTTFLCYCHNVSFGLATKARACKDAGQVEGWESHFMLLGVWENVREWTLTLPSEFPLWELEFRWTFESLESNFRGQNPLDWRVPYVIEKLLELKCLKWSCMTHLDTSNTSYGQKKGRESNCQIWLPTTKSRESPRFPCVKVACYIPLESFWRGI
jgi:hypothetical protein